MPDLQLLTREMDQVMERQKTRRDKPRREWSAEDRSADQQDRERALALEGLIQDETDRVADEDFRRLEAKTSEPIRSIMPGSQPLDFESNRMDTMKRLERAGWSLQNGALVAQTSSGKPQVMYDEAVLFGPLPQDSDAQRYYAQTRAIFQPGYREAYAKYLRNSVLYRSEAIAFSRLTTSEQNALSEGTDTAGGFLVPPDIQAEVLQRVAQQSVMRQICTVVNTSRDRIQFPAVAANTTSGSIYSSNFVGTWVGETPSQTDTDPTFELFEIGIKKARVSTRLSNDFIADAANDIMAWLARNGAENMALVEDNGFIAGTGASNQPLGVLNGGSSTVDVEGSTSDTISNTTSAAGSLPKIITLNYTVPAAYANRASWLVCRAIEGKIAGLVDANGRPVWLNYNQGGLDAGPERILGRPLYVSDFVPTDGTNANKVMIFGDFSAYIIAQRAQISTTVLRERYADTDQTGIILWERVGGGLWNTDAFRFGIV